MKTIGGYTIENFIKLENQIFRSILEPHIYEGLVKDVPNIHDKNTNDVIITWDKFGRCHNFNRKDCFIDINDIT